LKTKGKREGGVKRKKKRGRKRVRGMLQVKKKPDSEKVAVGKMKKKTGGG